MCQFLDLIRDWTDWLEVVERSPKTVVQYRRRLVTFVADTGLDLREVTRTDVVRYLKTLTPKAGTKANQLTCLRSFYKWAHAEGRVVDNPTILLPFPRRERGPAPFIPEEQMLGLVMAAAEHRPSDPRRAPAIVFLLVTGARIESACHVAPTDCYPARRNSPPEVHFRVVKNDRPYRVPVNNPLAQWAVSELLRLRHWTNPRALTRLPTLIGVGTGRLWQWVNDASRESGVRAWPHLLRHTFATELAPITDPATWADMMNHADLSQYRRYAGVPEQRKQDASARMWS